MAGGRRWKEVAGKGRWQEVAGDDRRGQVAGGGRRWQEVEGECRIVQVAARCLETAVQGAGHNVDINLKDITVTGVRKLFLILAVPPPGLGLPGWPGRGRQEGGGEGGEREG